MSLEKVAGQVDRLAQQFVTAYEDWIGADLGHTAAQSYRDELREIWHSIRYRLEAVRFHVHLLQQAHDEAENVYRADPDSADRLTRLRQTARTVQFLFDDLVFNAVSLFDYIGCAVSLSTEEKREAKWSKGLGKAKASPKTTRTAPVMKKANKDLVEALERYRSDLIHWRADEADGYISQDVLAGIGVEFRVTAPKRFAGLLGSGTDTPVATAARELATHSAEQAASVLEALIQDVANFPYTRAPANASIQTRRWMRSGLTKDAASDPRLQMRGIKQVGAILTENFLTPTPTLTGGTAVEAASINVKRLLAEAPNYDALREAVIQSVVLTLDQGDQPGRRFEYEGEEWEVWTRQPEDGVAEGSQVTVDWSGARIRRVKPINDTSVFAMLYHADGSRSSDKELRQVLGEALGRY